MSNGTAYQAATTTLTIPAGPSHKVQVLGMVDVTCTNSNCGSSPPTISTVIQEGTPLSGAVTFKAMPAVSPSEVTIPNQIVLTGSSALAPGTYTFALWVSATWSGGPPNPTLVNGNIAVIDLGT
jgi:hypothetical protein